MGLKSSSVPLQRSVNLASFAPGGALTTVNFEQALIDAIAYAEALPAVGDVPLGVVIECPAGEWPMTQTLRIQARSAYAQAPLIRFPGSSISKLSWAAIPTGGTHAGAGVCIWLDGAAALFHRGGLQGVMIQCSDSAATGVYFEQLLFSKIQDVVVRNAHGRSAVSGQAGLVASCAVADTTYGTQVWTGLTGMTENSVARVLTTTGATTGVNNGTFLITHYLSATSVRVYNPSGTSDASNGALHWTENFQGSGYRTRGDYTDSRGNTINNNQNVRFDQVSAEICGVSYWLESCTEFTITHGISNQALYNDWVLSHNVEMTWYGGMGQSGGATFYTIFELPQKFGGKSVTFEGIYHEGSVTSILKTFPPTSGTADYVLRRVTQSNVNTYIDVNGTRSVLCEMPGGQSPPAIKWLKARNCDKLEFSGHYDPIYDPPWADTSVMWDLDLRSRNGFSLHCDHRPYLGQIVPEKSLNKMLITRGLAVAIFDPRVVNKRTVSGGNLQAITDLVNGIVAGPQNAGIYPTFTASSADFGNRPSWSNVASGSAVLTGALTATISSGLLAGKSPSLLVVCRLPDATNFGAGTRSVKLAGASSYEISVGLADTNGPSDKITGRGFPVSGVFAIKDADTLAQCVYVGDGLYYVARETYLWGGCGDAEAAVGGDRSAISWPAGSNTLTIGGTIAGQPSAVLEIAYVAVLSRGLTTGERNAALDMMAVEWPGIARY